MPLLNRCGGGSADLQSKTVAPTTSSQTVKPDSGYDGLSQVTVSAMPSGKLSKPAIKVNLDGVITADSGVSTAGHLSTSASESNTYQMNTVSGGTITPGTSQKTAIASGRYATGTIYVAGDYNLKASNIKRGVSVFGITGTHGGYISLNGKYCTKRERVIGSSNYEELTFTIPTSDLSDEAGNSPKLISILPTSDFSTSLTKFTGALWLSSGNQSFGADINGESAVVSISWENTTTGLVIKVELGSGTVPDDIEPKEIDYGIIIGF